jgi:hypothetical protein
VTDIVLSTLNARYSHASLGLRCLRANLGELRPRSVIREFVIGLRTLELVERLLADSPRIVALGVYIWNVDECTRLVAQLRVVAPDVLIVLGGPEVSFPHDAPAIVSDADYVITGWGEVSLPALCAQLLAGSRPLDKFIKGIQPPLSDLAWPFDEFTDRDLQTRNLYIEASRGCPFKCEFCLSALDKTAWPFPLDDFLVQLETLYARGARRFKFVDRTFNLNVKTSRRILGFFLDKLAANPHDPVFAHFELVPDHLPDDLRSVIAQFPPGTLQFEIGIQTYNPQVQARISRRQDNAQADINLRWLREHSHAHMHVDLIAGLPGEDLASFAAGFDRLVALNPHEIQLGLLKRLRGAPIVRHTIDFAMRYDPHPPYTLLTSSTLDFATMQAMGRLANHWDWVANSGRFSEQLPALLGDAPFARFAAFSQWLHAQLDASARVSPERLASLVAQWLGVSNVAGAGAVASVTATPAPVKPKSAQPQRQQRHAQTTIAIR